MIPASSFLLDGDTALVVVEKPDPNAVGNWHDFNDACGTCFGHGSRKIGNHLRDESCPDCGGTGRHTFDIVVAGAWGDPPTPHEVHRVHVIDVLGIHDAMHPEYPGVIELTPGRFVLIESVDVSSYNIAIPPDAAPGMWLVRLAVHP